MFQELLTEPLVPFLAEVVGGFGGDGGEGIDDFDSLRVFGFHDFVEKNLNGLVAPAVAILGEEELDMSVFEVGELWWEGINGDDFDGAGLPLEGVTGEERPATDHGPALDFGVGGLFALDGGSGFLGGFFVVDGINDGHAGMLGKFIADAFGTGLEIGCGLVSGEDDHVAFIAHEFGEFLSDADAAGKVVSAIEGEALGFGGVGIEAHDGNAGGDRFIDGRGENVGVGATDGDSGDAGARELFNGLGLLLGILFRRGLDVDFDIDAVLCAKFLGGVLGSLMSGLEDRVALAFGDNAENEFWFGLPERDGGERQ